MSPKCLLAFSMLALAACKTAAPVATAPAPAPTIAPTAAATAPALNYEDLNAVLWMQTAVEYRANAAQTYHAAAMLLDKALKEKNWNALVPEERNANAARLKPAVVLDVDETVLDNSPYQARLIRDGKEYDEVSWDAWVSEEKAKAVPGVVDFANAARARGITLLYISNRDAHLKDATIANLKAIGLPVPDDSVFLGLGTFVKDCEQNGSEKLCRRELAGQKYHVLMQFGDQLGDFMQVLDSTPKGRNALYAQYADWFGERWFMLANPSYGAWEPALFDNDYTKPRSERDAAKLEALDVAQ